MNRETILSYMPEYVPQTGTTMVVAMAIHKLSLPIRIPLTFALVPRAHRLATKMGIAQTIERLTSSIFPAREVEMARTGSPKSSPKLTPKGPAKRRITEEV